MNDTITNHDNLSNPDNDLLMSSKCIRTYNVLLARKLNTTKAIFINQIHYWTEKLKDENHYHDGRYWVYESYASWQKQFPEMTVKTIQRTLTSLADEGYIYVGNYNKKSYDKTKWYALNYEKINETILEQQKSMDELELAMDKMSTGHGQNVYRVMDKMSSPIPKNSSKTSSKTSKDILCISQDETALYIRDVKKYVSSLRKHLPDDLTPYESDQWLWMLEYFFIKYETRLGKPHRIISKNELSKFINNANDYLDGLKGMIDLHFDTDYGKPTNMALSFFSGERTLEILYYRYQGLDYEELPFE